MNMYRYSYDIERVFFNRGLISLPKLTVVKNGTETVPEFTLDQMKGEDFKIAMAISVEMMRFGKILSPAAFYSISQLSYVLQVELATNIKTYLSELYVDGVYLTLFGDFPNTVLAMSQSEMLCHQILHYWGAYLGIEYWPNMSEGFDSESASQDIENIISSCCKEKYDVFDAASADDLADALVPLLSSQQSLTSRDKEDIAVFYKNLDVIALSPSKKLEMKNLDIPFKETLCVVASSCYDTQVIKDINDVLRVAMFMSGSDISLAPIPKVKDLGWRKVSLTKEDKKEWNFKNFTNPETRLLLSSIDSIAKEKKLGAAADMKKYALRWIRLGEKLHPMSAKNKKKYPEAYKMFNLIRNNIDLVQTYGSKVEKAKAEGSLPKILELLKSRPGEFARQLDWLLRTFTENKPVDQIDSTSVMQRLIKKAGLDYKRTQEELTSNLFHIVHGFREVLPKISTKVLYELLDHFNERKLPMPRKVFIKGARKPVEIPTLPPMNEGVITAIQNVVLGELVSRMAEKEDLTGVTVWLDKNLENIMLPRNMRSTGDAVKQVSRGTSSPLPVKSGLLRFFLFWEDQYGSEDLDLSVTFFKEDLSYHSQITWSGNYKLFNKNGKQYAQFSGDVRHHRGKCAEYIDVHIEEALNSGARYLVATARDFNSNSFTSAFGGLMARTKWGTPGETTWAPATVENGFKICSKTQNVVLCSIDLKKKMMTYIDEDLVGIPWSCGEYNSDQMKNLLERYLQGNRFFNALTLLETYYTACGAETIILSTEEIAEKKQEISTMIDHMVSKASSEESQNEESEDIDKYAHDNRVVEFDDIFSDYSKLLSYMF